MPMRRVILLPCLLATALAGLPGEATAQQPPANRHKPCSQAMHRQFDFWIGEWEAFGLKGAKAGDSKISVILDSCVILEEWTSDALQQGLRYAGKSFNTYNSAVKQWQQTWTDNTGNTIFYTEGIFEDNKIIYKTAAFKISKDTLAVRKLTFFNIDKNNVRQLGEISKDNG